MWCVKVDHNTGIYTPYSFPTVMWVLLCPTRTRYLVLALWDGTYGFSSLSKKTSKSNRLHDVITKAALSSHLKTLGVGPAGDRIRDLPLRRPTLSQLSQPGGGSSALASSLFYASVNSSCAQPLSPPPPPLVLIPGISIFFALDGKFPGLGTLELSNPSVWDEKRERMPRPPSTLQHFSLIALSNSAVLSILMGDFLCQLTSFLVIALGF